MLFNDCLTKIKFAMTNVGPVRNTYKRIYIFTFRYITHSSKDIFGI